MRLFVGIELPSRVRDVLAAHVSACKTTLPPAKWVSRESYHITLAFLGELEETAVCLFDRPLSQAIADQQSFRLQLFKAGYFPPGRAHARVVWVGVEDEPSIIRLQTRVATALNEAGLLEAEQRPYHPHVTVARCRRPWVRSRGDSWTSSLDGPLGESYEVKEIVLYRSLLESSGARYDSVGAYPFGALN